ncbi:conserved hypothetical protein (plasmid) [Nitrosococcus halophilus Nc 4]|uniref:Uncharacterized protein n=1 Tax=Nitrosococcus halophilus (strain Nc4) TaxID=472759 RepID=D5C5E8_NITHN|nr:hypothetical protein [Nitrosococcus halophilus]ADE17002.1 conserved hypothetical protein [Nitrosococcus halophilus Nc 4]
MFPAGVVAVAGSRSLPPGGSGLVSQVAGALVRSGQSLVVGCCVGADAAVLSFGSGSLGRVRCLAAFGPVSPPFRAPSGRYSAPGAWSGSAVREVAEFLLAGGSVRWWSGGGPSAPLPVRLAARTRAVVAVASVGLVVFFASPSSRGSLLAARCAASRGLPVLAFAVGFPGSALPPLGSGSWAPCSGSGVWSGAWRWAPEQESLFLW